MTTPTKTESRLAQEIAWKQQAVRDAVRWAGIHVKDEKRLEDFKAGVETGWNAAVSTFKLHGWLSID